MVALSFLFRTQRFDLHSHGILVLVIVLPLRPFALLFLLGIVYSAGALPSVLSILPPFTPSLATTRLTIPLPLSLSLWSRKPVKFMALVSYVSPSTVTPSTFQNLIVCLLLMFFLVLSLLVVQPRSREDPWSNGLLASVSGMPLMVPLGSGANTFVEHSLVWARLPQPPRIVLLALLSRMSTSSLFYPCWIFNTPLTSPCGLWLPLPSGPVVGTCCTCTHARSFSSLTYAVLVALENSSSSAPLLSMHLGTFP